MTAVDTVAPARREATTTPALVLATVVLVAALIGGNFTALKFALDHTDPFLLAALRTIVGGSFLVGIALLRGERFPTDPTLLARIFVVGFSITTMSSALLVFGVSRVPAGFASLMSSTMATKEPDVASFPPFEGAVDDGDRTRRIDGQFPHQ